ncbi:MAG: ribosome silencing factor [Alphaproteobacteria bacterium]|nr:ribosome silencing factor [Alphaproteobacteria bacterium]
MRSVISLYEKNILSAEETCTSIKNYLDERKALDIVEVSLVGKSTIADYMVIANGTSQKHIQMMAELLKEHLHGLGVRPVFIEGANTSEWILLDAGSVIVHLFRPEVRSLYNLEKIWGSELAGFSSKAAVEESLPRLQ